MLLSALKFSFSLCPPSIHFLKGLDPRVLTPSQQHQISLIPLFTPSNDSFLIFNPNELTRKILHWRTKLPWIKPFYAVKANNLPMFCGEIIKHGLGMDCASKGEIEGCLALGGKAKDIVYANSVKNEKDLVYAYENGVELTLADTLDEIDKIKRLAPKMKILWRVAVEQEEQDDLFWGYSSKFGDDLETDSEIRTRMKQIQSLGVRLHGVHFHSGSTRKGSLGYSKGISLARRCMRIGREYGHRMEVMDIGGGFPSGDLGDEWLKGLEGTRGDLLGYEVIAEPGRFLCDNMFYLCNRVIGKRVKRGVKCYHVNDSIYHTYNTVLIEQTEFLEGQFYGRVGGEKNKEEEGEKRERISLFGMTLDGSDIITKGIEGPKGKELEIGDWLVIGGFGGYSYSMKSGFNGMKAVEECYRWEGDIEGVL